MISVAYLLRSNSNGTAAIPLLGDCQLDTLALRQRDPSLVLTNDEDVGQSGSEGVVNGILDVNNVETSVVALTVGDNTNTSHVTTTGNHSYASGVESNVLCDLTGLKVDLDGVVDLDCWVWIADSSGIVGDQVWDAFSTKLHSSNLGKLVSRLLVSDSVDGEATLGIVDEPEVLAGLLNGDDIHETSWEGWVRADLAVDLDEALHDNSLGFTSVQGIFQPVSDEDNERHALPLLVRTWGRLWCIFSGKLVKQPVGGRCKTLHVFLWSSSHFVGFAG